MIYKIHATPGPLVEKATPPTDLAGSLEYARCLSLADLGAHRWTVQDLAGAEHGAYQAGVRVK